LAAGVTPVDRQPVNRQDEQIRQALKGAMVGEYGRQLAEAALDELLARVRDLEAALRPAADRTCVYSTTHGGCSCYSCVARAALAPAENQPRAEGAWGQPYADAMRFVPEGDERCEEPKDACRCMKRKGHDGNHACSHGYWAAAPAEER
jgi:hypothetical protein